MGKIDEEDCYRVQKSEEASNCICFLLLFSTNIESEIGV